MSIPVLLDCDPGHDDAMAIMLAAGSPAVELLGITTVAGNQTLDKTTLNARRVCTVAGIRCVPIAAGRAGPLHGPLRTAPDVHGESGLDGPEFGEPTVGVEADGAVEFSRRVLHGAAAPVTLIATGPLTNVAALLLAHPEAAGHIREIVLMGGSTGRGNVTPYAEFNIHVDPEAAGIVFGSGLPVTMCGLNVTHQALATDEVVRRITGLGTPLAGICAEMLTFFRGRYRRRGFTAPPLHDPVAVARVIDPSVVEVVDAHVAVELAGTHTRGATVADLDGVTGQQPNARVATALDTGRFWKLMVDALAALG
ncbi:MAG TPA: nucleoside hydrolase [Streptosporangiaceae bacterium]|nr:nucleoside hydrolase [Streptosporangiaceae bacterium]